MKYLVLSMIFLTGCVPANDYIYVREPSYVTTGMAMVGLHERKNHKELKKFLGVDPRYVEWCAAYVNAILEMHGYETTDSLMARSFLEYGEEVPLPEGGDIVVLRRGASWQGHVGFFVAKEVIDGKVYYLLLGGNQSDAVTVEPYPASKVLSVRRFQ